VAGSTPGNSVGRQRRVFEGEFCLPQAFGAKLIPLEKGIGKQLKIL
jgi:hypothetical protein